MSELKCEKRTMIVVEYSNLERFINDEMGFAYDIPSSEELGNDSVVKFRVDGSPLDNWTRPKFEALKAGKNESFMIREIMNVLCADGKIESGEYLVTVCW